MYHDKESKAPKDFEESSSNSFTKARLTQENKDLYDALNAQCVDARRHTTEVERQYRNAPIPNYSLPKRLSVVAPNFVDEHQLSKNQKKAVRESMLAIEEICLLSDQEAKALLHWRKRLEMIMLFAVAVTLTGIDPLLDQWALIVPGTSRKEFYYIPQSPYLLSYLMAAMTASCLAFAVDSKTAKDVWRPTAILIQIPLAIAFVFGDWASAFCARRLNASLIKVISQTKLLVTGLLAWALLGTRQSLTQWLLILASTVLIVAYGLHDTTSDDDALAAGDIIGIVVAVVNVCVSCICGVFNEMSTKRVKYRYMAQMAHNRWACTVTALAQMSFVLSKSKSWHRFPFGGWGWAQIMIALVDFCKSWLSMLMIKRLNSVWKVLASALSLGVTYVLSSLFFTSYGAKPFTLGAFSIVSGISIIVLAYAASKRDESKLLQAVADAQRRIELGP